MGVVLKLCFLPLVLFSTVSAQCSVDDLRCCLSQFLTFVNQYKGIQLTEENVASACTIRQETLECMEMFELQCVKDAEKLTESINETKEFIQNICPPTSEFISNVTANEKCFVKSSESFQTCFNKTVIPESSDDDESKWKAECCEYKALRNCAVQTTENTCGPSASQLIHKEVVLINGLGLEVACEDLFDKCNSGLTLASSAAFIVLLLSVCLFIIL